MMERDKVKRKVWEKPVVVKLSLKKTFTGIDFDPTMEDFTYRDS